MIELKSDTEAKLKALAHAAGVSVEEFLLSLVSGARQSSEGQTKPAGQPDPITEFRTWVNRFSTPGPGLSDEAISRESIYER